MLSVAKRCSLGTPSVSKVHSIGAGVYSSSKRHSSFFADKANAVADNILFKPRRQFPAAPLSIFPEDQELSYNDFLIRSIERLNRARDSFGEFMSVSQKILAMHSEYPDNWIMSSRMWVRPSRLALEYEDGVKALAYLDKASMMPDEFNLNVGRLKEQSGVLQDTSAIYDIQKAALPTSIHGIPSANATATSNAHNTHSYNQTYGADVHAYIRSAARKRNIALWGEETGSLSSTLQHHYALPGMLIASTTPGLGGVAAMSGMALTVGPMEAAGLIAGSSVAVPYLERPVLVRFTGKMREWCSVQDVVAALLLQLSSIGADTQSVRPYAIEILDLDNSFNATEMAYICSTLGALPAVAAVTTRLNVTSKRLLRDTHRGLHAQLWEAYSSECLMPDHQAPSLDVCEVRLDRVQPRASIYRGAALIGGAGVDLPAIPHCTGVAYAHLPAEEQRQVEVERLWPNRVDACVIAGDLTSLLEAAELCAQAAEEGLTFVAPTFVMPDTALTLAALSAEARTALEQCGAVFLAPGEPTAAALASALTPLTMAVRAKHGVAAQEELIAWERDVVAAQEEVFDLKDALPAVFKSGATRLVASQAEFVTIVPSEEVLRQNAKNKPKAPAREMLPLPAELERAARVVSLVTNAASLGKDGQLAQSGVDACVVTGSQMAVAMAFAGEIAYNPLTDTLRTPSGARVLLVPRRSLGEVDEHGGLKVEPPMEFLDRSVMRLIARESLPSSLPPPQDYFPHSEVVGEFRENTPRTVNGVVCAVTLADVETTAEHVDHANVVKRMNDPDTALVQMGEPWSKHTVYTHHFTQRQAQADKALASAEEINTTNGVVSVVPESAITEVWRGVNALLPMPSQYGYERTSLSALIKASVSTLQSPVPDAVSERVGVHDWWRAQDVVGMPIVAMVANGSAVVEGVRDGKPVTPFMVELESLARTIPNGEWAVALGDVDEVSFEYHDMHAGGAAAHTLSACDASAAWLRKLGCKVVLARRVASSMQRALKAHGILVLHCPSLRESGAAAGDMISITQVEKTLLPYSMPEVWLHQRDLKTGKFGTGTNLSCVLPYDVPDMIWHRCGSTVNAALEAAVRKHADRVLTQQKVHEQQQHDEQQQQQQQQTLQNESNTAGK